MMFAICRKSGRYNLRTVVFMGRLRSGTIVTTPPAMPCWGDCLDEIDQKWYKKKLNRIQCVCRTPGE